MFAESGNTAEPKTTGSGLSFSGEAALDHWIRTWLQLKRKNGPVVFLDSQLDGHSSSQCGYIASDPVLILEYRDPAVHRKKPGLRIRRIDDRDEPETGKSHEIGESHESRERLYAGESRKAGMNHETGQILNSRESMNTAKTGNAGERLNVWEELKRFREQYRDWMFGWFSYDLKNESENLASRNKDPVALPDLCFFVPGTIVEVDRKKCRVRVIKGDEMAGEMSPDYPDHPEYDPATGLVSGNPIPGHSGSTSGHPEDTFRIGPLESGDGWEAYRRKVQKIKQYIIEGETYEVNLTHQLRAPCKGETLDLFFRMKNHGPVPFAAWVHFEGTEISSSSPERFLEHRSGRIRSQPIKGTSPRGGTPEQDRKMIRDILKKEKNKAENVMIVDLVRHDIGQVARTGTVFAESLLEVQTFSTVHQLVSTIRAERRPEVHPVDVIRACFPMGSMTGAPKIRTMQIIDEVESYRRGLYSGAIGYFTPDDDFDLNVVIRTAIRKDDTLYYSVGGAITADSDPGEEWEESWLKAKALAR